MNEDCQFAFDRLKQVLTQAQAYSDFTIRFTLATDTSDDGLGCVLGQVQNSKGVVTGYADRQLLPAERNYSVKEREALALISGYAILEVIFTASISRLSTTVVPHRFSRDSMIFVYTRGQ